MWQQDVDADEIAARATHYSQPPQLTNTQQPWPPRAVTSPAISGG
jgi:hypothetical protein